MGGAKRQNAFRLCVVPPFERASEQARERSARVQRPRDLRDPSDSAAAAAVAADAAAAAAAAVVKVTGASERAHAAAPLKNHQAG